MTPDQFNHLITELDTLNFLLAAIQTWLAIIALKKK